MAILRTRSSRHQMWMDLPEVLPFGYRYAPAPLPAPLPDPLPLSGSRAYWDAPLHVRRARDRLDDADHAAMSAMLIETALAGCARLDASELPQPEVAPVPFLNTAEVFVLSALGRMFMPGSLPSMYRRVVSARWTMAPKPEGSEWVRAVASFEMWDGLRGACHVEAVCRGIRHQRPTGTVDLHGDQVMRMVTSPSTWLSMGWDRMDGGPCVWEPNAGAWRRCKAEAAGGRAEWLRT